MSHLRLQVQLWLRLHGWWPVAASALAGITGVLYLALLPKLDADLHALGLQQQTQAAELAHLNAPGHAVPRQAAGVQDNSVEHFERQLTSAKDRSKFLAQMWHEADHLGVRLGKVDFHEDVDAAGGYVRLRMNVPASGSYPAIKNFTFVLMRAYPALGLETIEFKRERVAQGDVDGLLHVVLMMRP